MSDFTTMGRADLLRLLGEYSNENVQLRENNRELKSSLTFAKLRVVNVARCEAVFHGLDRWSPTDWGCAMAGEAGEACNIIKKLRRLDDGPKPAYYEGEKTRLAEEAALELADVIIYCDLLAARLGYTLEEVVKTKFNVVSNRRGSHIKL